MEKKKIIGVVKHDNSKAINDGYSTSQKHYKARSPIETMQLLMTPEQLYGFCIGNAIKYRMRAEDKGQYESDMNKARQYTYWARLAKNMVPIDPAEGVPSCFKNRLF